MIYCHRCGRKLRHRYTDFGGRPLCRKHRIAKVYRCRVLLGMKASQPGDTIELLVSMKLPRKVRR